ncbi:MAG: hypothetical protein ACFE9L_01530 [Candidatus Hodarchaeota archaeon]
MIGKRKSAHNAENTCCNCPAAIFKGNVNFRSCGQLKEEIDSKIQDSQIIIECARRPELGYYEPSITFEECPEWIMTPNGLMLR